MKKIFLVLLLAATPALALAQSSQQEKMAACNAEAAKKELKGEDRKAFMSDCLSAKKESKEDKKELTAQQQKMKTCNAKARGLKGEEFKKVRNECLKN